MARPIQAIRTRKKGMLADLRTLVWLWANMPFRKGEGRRRPQFVTARPYEPASLGGSMCVGAEVSEDSP
jgi:hypothetical protein